MAHDELQSLLGAYALHAVEPEEAQALERHVENCPRCTAELAQYLAAAPFLGGAGGEPPEGIWESVVETINQPATNEIRRAVLRTTKPSSGRRRSWLTAGVVGVAAALAALALWAAVLEGRVHQLENESSSGALRRAAASALVAPGHRSILMSAPSGEGVADVVVTSGGSAYLVSSSLPELPTGRTYQLWALNGQVPVSLGVLGREAATTAFRVEPGMSLLMITAEPSGGVAQPDSAVLARGVLTPT